MFDDATAVRDEETVPGSASTCCASFRWGVAVGVGMGSSSAARAVGLAGLRGGESNERRVHRSIAHPARRCIRPRSPRVRGEHEGRVGEGGWRVLQSLTSVTTRERGAAIFFPAPPAAPVHSAACLLAYPPGSSLSLACLGSRVR